MQSYRKDIEWKCTTIKVVLNECKQRVYYEQASRMLYVLYARVCLFAYSQNWNSNQKCTQHTRVPPSVSIARTGGTNSWARERSCGTIWLRVLSRKYMQTRASAVEKWIIAHTQSTRSRAKLWFINMYTWGEQKCFTSHMGFHIPTSYCHILLNVCFLFYHVNAHKSNTIITRILQEQHIQNMFKILFQDFIVTWADYIIFNGTKQN